MSRWNRFVSENYKWASGKTEGNHRRAYNLLSSLYRKYKPYFDLVDHGESGDLSLNRLYVLKTDDILAVPETPISPPQTIDYYTYRKNNYVRIRKYLESHMINKPTFKQVLEEVGKQWRDTAPPVQKMEVWSVVPKQGTPFIARVYGSPYIYYFKNTNRNATNILLGSMYSDERRVFDGESAYEEDVDDVSYSDVEIIPRKENIDNIAYINDERLKDGQTNCLLTPILEVFDDRRFYIKKKYGQQTYSQKMDIIKSFLDKSSDGVGYEDIKQICEDVSVSIHIYEITGDKYFSYVPTKRSILSVNYIHSKFGHVDRIFSDINKQEVNQEELREIYKNLCSRDEQFVFKSKNGARHVYEINTHDTVYKLQNTEFSSFYKHLTDQVFCIDHNADRDISNFVSCGCHINMARNLEPGLREKYCKKMVYCVDHNKSYSNYESNRFYMGFPSSITELVNMDKTQEDITSLPVGFYKIEDITDLPDDINILFCYVDGGIYPLPDLYFLKDIGAKFNIIAGAYGNTVHLKMRDDKYEKLDDVPYYSLASGRLMSLSKYKHIWYNKVNDENLLNHYQNVYGRANVDMFEDGTIKISKKIDKRYHYRHVGAFITSYSRISTLYMYLQICKKAHPLRIVSDGIYFEGDSSLIEYDPIYFKMEHKLIPGFRHCDSYISTYTKAYNITRYEDSPKWKRVELYNGEGGCGKTHKALIEYGKISCFTCVCWNLSERKREEYGIPQNTVIAKLLGQECEAERVRYPVIVVDEITMLNPSTTIEIINRFPNHKIILCGDYNKNWEPNQLMPVVDDIKKLIHFREVLKFVDNIHEFSVNHRIKCDKLRELLKSLSLKSLPKLTPKEVANMATDDDIILTSLRICRTCKKYFGCGCEKKNGLQLFNSLEYPNRTYKKYMIVKKCLYNGRKHFRGQIIKEKTPNSEYRAAQTIHQIQGDTIKAPKKIFIDTRDMFDPNALYVALSRAEEISQLYLIRT